MTNYVQTQDAGDIYVRAKSITLNNPKDGLSQSLLRVSKSLISKTATLSQAIYQPLWVILTQTS